MTRLRRTLGTHVTVLAIAFGLAFEPGSAQETPDSTMAADAVAADPLTVHLLTAGPGPAVWERFGHNGIWIHDARTGEDVVWEWGVFDFQQENFLQRLARGTMLYSMQAAPLQWMVSRYREAGRDVWAQELALTPDQEFALLARVMENGRPENRDYTYHYYLDNCSTRVRDHLDAVVGGAIGDAMRGAATGVTWRDHTLRLLRPDPAAWVGIQYVLGRPGDREIDRWDELFLPLKLRDAVADVSVPDGAGGSRPLVVSEERLTREGDFALVQTAPTWWPIALGIGGLLVGLVALLLGGGSTSAPRAPRAAGLLLVLWGAAVGVAGTILLVAVLFTDHDFWRWNENLFLASPLTFGWVAVGFGLLRKGRVGGRSIRIAGLLGALAAAGILLALIPGGQQTLSTSLVLGSVPVAAWVLLRTSTVSPPSD